MDPNFTNISKLPRTSRSFSLSRNPPKQHLQATRHLGKCQHQVLLPNRRQKVLHLVWTFSFGHKTRYPFGISAIETNTDAFKPSRRVRTVPGGPHSDIFNLEDDDALSQAPPKPAESQVGSPGRMSSLHSFLDMLPPSSGNRSAPSTIGP